MLVLTRKLQEQIQIGDNITITVVRVKGQSVRIGIDAPHEVRVMRAELPPKAVAEPAAADECCDGDSSAHLLAQAAPAPEARPSVRPATPSTQASGQRCSPLAGHVARLPGVARTAAPAMRRPERMGPSSLRCLTGRW